MSISVWATSLGGVVSPRLPRSTAASTSEVIELPLPAQVQQVAQLSVAQILCQHVDAGEHPGRGGAADAERRRPGHQLCVGVATGRSAWDRVDLAATQRQQNALPRAEARDQRGGVQPGSLCRPRERPRRVGLARV